VWNKRGGFNSLSGTVGMWIQSDAKFHCNAYPWCSRNSTDCNYFSQMVWADTQKVGCAIQFCDPGDNSGLWPIVSCQYFPAGNIHPQKATPTCTAAPMDPVPPPPAPQPEPVPQPALVLPGSNPPEVPETDDCTDEITPTWQGRVNSCADAVANRWCDAIYPACGVSCNLCKIKSGAVQSPPPPPQPQPQPQPQPPALACDDKPMYQGILYNLSCEANSQWCSVFDSDDFCRISCGKCGQRAAAQQATTTTEANTAGTVTTASSTSTDASMPGWAIGLIVLGSIMVLLLIVIVLLVLRK